MEDQSGWKLLHLPRCDVAVFCPLTIYYRLLKTFTEMVVSQLQTFLFYEIRIFINFSCLLLPATSRKLNSSLTLDLQGDFSKVRGEISLT